MISRPIYERGSIELNGNNFVIEMGLKPVPSEVYQELGQAEVDYTQLQMNSGKLTQLLVTPDHKKYWMVWECVSQEELLSLLQGFPLHDYFDYTVHAVMDMVVASKAGMTDPALDS